LRFIQQARQLGFSVREVSALVALWRNKRRASADVRRLATAHLRDIDARITELKRMQQTLGGLISAAMATTVRLARSLMNWRKKNINHFWQHCTQPWTRS
jgi:DNA-binding transcriptional MerR regulator